MPDLIAEVLSLWLPIVVATVAVWFASFLLWALITAWHKPDMKKVPDLDAADAVFKGLNLGPGHYYMPQPASNADWKTDAFQKRYDEGPWISMTVFPGKPSMGKNMVLTLFVFFVVSVGIAYLLAIALAPGAAFMDVFQVACTGGVLAYTFGGIINGIWFGKPVGYVVRDVIDAAIYACVTAAVFAWLWPGVPTPAA